MTLLPSLMASALLAMSVAMACGEEARMQPSIQEVKQKHEAELMELPGVVSVGIGRDEQGRAVIAIGLDRDRPEVREQLPQRLEGYDVHTTVVGKPAAQ